MTTDTVKKYFQQKASDYSQKQSSWFWQILRCREEISVLDMIGDVVGNDVLELGSGSGYYAQKLIKLGAKNVVAVDQCDEMISNIDMDGITPIVGLAESICLDQRFDLILAVGLLEFVTDPLAVLKNAYAHADQHSVLVVMVPTSNIFSTFYAAFHKSHGISIRQYDEDIICDLLNQAGWIKKRVHKTWPFSLVVQAQLTR
jgi:SAM-dependent methyltransferase